MAPTSLNVLSHASSATKGYVQDVAFTAQAPELFAAIPAQLLLPPPLCCRRAARASMSSEPTAALGGRGLSGNTQVLRGTSDLLTRR